MKISLKTLNVVASPSSGRTYRSPTATRSPSAASRQARPGDDGAASSSSIGDTLGVDHDPAQADRGTEEGDGVDGDGDRRRDCLDQQAGKTATADLVRRLARGDLAVGVDQLVLLDDAG